MPSVIVRRATVWSTAPDLVSSWRRIAVRMKSVRFRVKALVDEQVDLAQINQANVDRDLLALVDLGHAPPLCIHSSTIQKPSSPS